jgi:hypothetical protein
MDHENRVFDNYEPLHHSYIKSIVLWWQLDGV